MLERNVSLYEKHKFNAVHATERSNVKKQRALVRHVIVACPAEQADNVDHNSLQNKSESACILALCTFVRRLDVTCSDSRSG